MYVKLNGLYEAPTKRNISKVKMALKFNKYFEDNSKCFSTTVTKKLTIE